MRTLRYTGALGVALALAISAPGGVSAQDTTRRAVSEQRIPVRKDKRIEEVSRGEVALSAEVARITALEEEAAALRQRVQTIEAEAVALRARDATNEALIRSLEENLRTTREELANVRGELALATARAAALAQEVARLDQRFVALKNGSLFGHSGFYIGAGTGMNFTTGTLNNIGYREGLNLVVPIGWSKPGKLLGVRAELGVQSFEGRLVPGFVNTDPMLYTATAMATLNLPINTAKTNLFYLMGGGGVFSFHHYGASSALSDRLGNAKPGVTKLGLVGGAGLELHVLGATSFFVESAVTNVFAEKSTLNAADGGRSLRWIPLVAGITLR